MPWEQIGEDAPSAFCFKSDPSGDGENVLSSKEKTCLRLGGAGTTGGALGSGTLSVLKVPRLLHPTLFCFNGVSETWDLGLVHRLSVAHRVVCW